MDNSKGKKLRCRFCEIPGSNRVCDWCRVNENCRDKCIELHQNICSNECSICLESLLEPEKKWGHNSFQASGTCTLHCGHSFHYGCWEKYQNHAQCPYCRSDECRIIKYDLFDTPSSVQLDTIIKVCFEIFPSIVIDANKVVLPNKPDDINIRIHTVTGKKIPFRVNVNTMIICLVLAFEKQSGNPPSFQRLIFKGRELNFAKTFKDYNITEGSMIGFVSRMRGC